MTRKTRNKIRATVAGGFSITELPYHSVILMLFGRKYMVKLTLIRISSTSKKDFTYIYEGTVKVNNKVFSNSDFTVKRLLKNLKLEIENFFRRKGNAKR